MINGLDLFSGIGGISEGLRDYVRPIAYCESDRYAQSVLLSRMRDGSIATAPIWPDVRTIDAGALRGRVDIVYGGFPCQDISAAGAGRGLAGERSGLYFEIENIVRAAAPTLVFLENVPAIRTRGLGRVVWGLSELGYDLRWTVVSAAEVGAPHLRKRWFMLAYAHGVSWSERNQSRKNLVEHLREPAQLRDRKRKTKPEVESVADSDRIGRGERVRRQTVREGRSDADGSCDDDASLEHADRARFEHAREGEAWSELTEGRDAAPSAGWWHTEPDVGRVANGVPLRVDRLRCLGNAVVPSQAKAAFERLIGLDD